MIELLLLGILMLGELVFIFWYVRESKRQQDKLINALISKNPQDQANLDLIDKLPVQKTTKVPEPELVATDTLNDDEFIEKVIGKEVS